MISLLLLVLVNIDPSLAWWADNYAQLTVWSSAWAEWIDATVGQVGKN